MEFLGFILAIINRLFGFERELFYVIVNVEGLFRFYLKVHRVPPQGFKSEKYHYPIYILYV